MRSSEQQLRRQRRPCCSFSRFIFVVIAMMASTTCCLFFVFLSGGGTGTTSGTGNNRVNRQQQHAEAIVVQQPAVCRIKGTLHHRYSQLGHVMLADGQHVNLTAELTTSVLYSFSPGVEEIFAEALYDNFEENRYVGLGPAIHLLEDRQTILTVQRIWLSHYDVLFNKENQLKTKNTWPENFLYSRRFNASTWQPSERGHIMGIPATTNCQYEYRSDGPMDPRIFELNGAIYLSFHLWHFDRADLDIRGRMFIWNYELNRLTKLEVPESFKPRLQRTEINWIPLVVDGITDSAFFIYSFDPLRVLRCTANGRCIWAQIPLHEERAKFDGSGDALRGGSAFVQYVCTTASSQRRCYYLALAHSQVSTRDDKLLYVANLIVLAVETSQRPETPTFRVVYVSAPIEMKEQFMQSAHITRQYTIKGPFIFPVGAILWRDCDCLDYGFHLSDSHAYIGRIKGISSLMDDVIEEDKQGDKLKQKNRLGKAPFRSIHKLVARDTAAYHRTGVANIFLPEIIEAS